MKYKENTGSSNRRSKRTRKDNAVSSQQQQSSTTPLQDFIAKEFGPLIKALIEDFKTLKRDYPTVNSVVDEKSEAPVIITNSMGMAITQYIDNGTSELFKKLQTAPKTSGVNPFSQLIFNLIVNVDPTSKYRI